MNLQQLEYIVAVDTHRHFVTAADHCFVTQATLSVMIKKLEEELGVRIFDRSRQPVVPTEVGIQIIAQARIILNETSRIKEVVNRSKRQLCGELKLGIIPTIAPYLVPLFLHDFLKKYPEVTIHLLEGNTEDLLRRLRNQQLDAAILATPLHTELQERLLYYEPFLIYAAPEEKLSRKKYVSADELSDHVLWLMEDGHCMRSQVMNICSARRTETAGSRLLYAAGSIETLIRLVDAGKGATILPELVKGGLSKKQRSFLREFKPAVPVREVSLVTRTDVVKQSIVEVLQQEITQSVIPHLTQIRKKNVMEII
jgi:LysR family hydrogen peroxide-inducible transcriptional activator